MKEALVDIRGAVALIALIGGLVAAVIAMLSGNQDQIEQFLAIAGGAVAFIVGLGSRPFAEKDERE